MDQALDLMRRLPPENVQDNLSALVDLAPELTEELLCRVDQPLQDTPSCVTEEQHQQAASGLWNPEIPLTEKANLGPGPELLNNSIRHTWSLAPEGRNLNIRTTDVLKALRFDEGALWNNFLPTILSGVLVLGCTVDLRGEKSFYKYFDLKGEFPKVAYDNVAMKDFLLCDYNRDGDSYRSPWSNTYFPALEDGAVPSPALRQLEAEANEVFAMYRDAYYEGGNSSVYLWDLQGGFAGCFLIKKVGSQGKKGLLADGFWDSIHVVEVTLQGDNKTASYKLTSTIMLSLSTKEGVKLGGSLTRQQEEVAPVADGHVVNIGQMIEEMENKMRNSLDQVYFGKTREVVSALNTPVDDTLEIRADSHKGIQMQASIISEMLAKNKKKEQALKPSEIAD